MRSRDTLIPRFLGLIRIKTAAGRNIRMVVMNNLMPDDVPIHEKYDLKGSTLGRWATAAERRDVNVTLEDLDFKHTLGLPQKTHDALIAQFESDCAWLRRASWTTRSSRSSTSRGAPPTSRNTSSAPTRRTGPRRAAAAAG